MDIWFVWVSSTRGVAPQIWYYGLHDMTGKMIPHVEAYKLPDEEVKRLFNNELGIKELAEKYPCKQA